LKLNKLFDVVFVARERDLGFCEWFVVSRYKKWKGRKLQTFNGSTSRTKSLQKCFTRRSKPYFLHQQEARYFLYPS